MTVGLTISAGYLAQQQELHRNPNYGLASLSFAPIVKEIIVLNEVRSLSDYGAGKQNLLRGLHELGVTGFDYFPYDPAFPDYGKPRPADLVCCIDVLEHVEPVFLDAVLKDLCAITIKRGSFQCIAARLWNLYLMGGTHILFSSRRRGGFHGFAGISRSYISKQCRMDSAYRSSQ